MAFAVQARSRRIISHGPRRGDRPGDGRIEHTRMQEVIKTADWVFDLGSKGGDRAVKWSTKAPDELTKSPGPTTTVRSRSSSLSRNPHGSTVHG
jgi:hypothetical protein